MRCETGGRSKAVLTSRASGTGPGRKPTGSPAAAAIAGALAWNCSNVRYIGWKGASVVPTTLANGTNPRWRYSFSCRTVPEMMASILYEATGKPWKYYRDMTRQLWDEARHAMMGEVGFVSMGIDWTTVASEVDFQIDETTWRKWNIAPVQARFVRFNITKSRGNPDNQLYYDMIGEVAINGEENAIVKMSSSNYYGIYYPTKNMVDKDPATMWISANHKAMRPEFAIADLGAAKTFTSIDLLSPPRIISVSHSGTTRTAP